MAADDIEEWTIHHSLRQKAVEMPDRIFVDPVGQPGLTYGEAWRRAARFAGMLRAQGVQAGDVVIVMARNGLPAIEAWLGIVLAGGVEAFVNTGYKRASLAHAIGLPKARFVVAEGEFLDRIAEIEDELPDLALVLCLDESEAGAGFRRVRVVHVADIVRDAVPFETPGRRFCDTASIVYTSGPTGPAKGVLMPHAQVHALARQAIAALKLGPDDVYYCFHPMFHTAGKFIGLFAGLLAGARVVFDKIFDAGVWLSRIREHGATATLAHGAMLEMVFARPERDDDADNPLRRLLASPFPKRMAERFETRFGVRGIETWGMTEINNPCCCSLDEPLRPGSCGRAPGEWAEVRVIDPASEVELPPGQVGEFVVRPRHPWTMMQGYIGMPEATVRAWRNLWFHTSDTGYVDEDGYFYFVDRAADSIRRRAENISSYDIESAAIELDGVVECAAVGVASGFEHDDDVKLYVVMEPGRSREPEKLVAELAKILPHFMVPRYIEYLDRLPRTPTNKVRKAELRGRPAGSRTWDRKASGLSLKELAR